MQGTQLVQIVLILAVVLRIGVVVVTALLFQLGVIVGQLIVVKVLRILLAACQLIQLAHQLVAAAFVGIQRQTVQGRALFSAPICCWYACCAALAA